MSTKRRSSDTIKGKSAKKSKEGEVAVLSSDLEDEGIRNGMKEAWRKKTSFSHGSVQLDCEPFPHCKIRNFVQNESFVENLRDELLRLNFHSKSNDLYKFQQSDDLKKRKEHHISEIRSLLFLQFRSWLSDMLGVDLQPTVDISCAKYEHTDVLLCHDDELEGRRIAFILYLVPPWDLSDGGTLDLYSTDEHYEPVSIVKSLLPCWNTLLFFEVSPVSFHQVSEVLTDEKCRLSLSGWFHGPSLQRPRRYTEPAVPRHTHVLSDESVLFEWVNEMYMDPLYQAQVQQEFEDTSEIRLANFLQEEKYKQVIEALRLAEIQWERRGPPNKRCYARAQLQNLPSCLKECWDLLSSEAFFLLLSNLTGLSLHALAAGDDESDSEGQDGESEGRDGPSQGRDGESEGRDRRSEGRDGESEGRDGQSEGRDGESEGRDGQSEERDGPSQGRDGESEGRDGESEGRDGESEGRDGQSEERDGESEERDGQSEERDGQSEERDGERNTDNGENERNDPDGQGPCSTSSSPEKKNKGPPVCVGELRRWSHGDYTLLHDSVKREFALDLLLHLGCTGWKAEFGGFTTYIAHDEDEELLTVYPEENSLALVYRDKETLKFVKHINHNSVVQEREDALTHFYDFSFTYYE
ncbi:prolyl 3-hydroxylase OGFOD1 [Pangasianodon hypophthalmus]|uniref:prolyl 3-hydroxylase OGFOD1 n=1 Tax=Pangasianodon hypophthalmus TaxID=310915 RepID=UPI002307E162|nr:prolyl 3-hydroxylase OGFOD1 [Pangasianodon hypophthalmus]